MEDEVNYQGYPDFYITKNSDQPNQELISSFSSPSLGSSNTYNPLVRRNIPTSYQGSLLLSFSFSFPPVKENNLKKINFPPSTTDVGFTKTPQELLSLVNAVRQMVSLF